ncbi:MAG: glutathione peroxidase [Candidatus Hydrogenedentota bacterium]
MLSALRHLAGRIVGRFLWSPKPLTGNGADVTGHAVESVDGLARPLGDRYPGQVLLLVNVASQCGLTPQYKGLVQLDDRFRARGLAVVAFPANNFGAQEPGTNDEIQAFCTIHYGVHFDVFKKISVNGRDIHPLYADLTSETANGPMGGAIQWNFTKFLVGRDGRVKARFEPGIAPMSKAVVQAIEQELGATS